MVACFWKPRVFVREATESDVAVYVDDMLMAATTQHTDGHRGSLEKKIRFEGQEEDMSKYLGARYMCDPFGPKTPTVASRFAISRVAIARWEFVQSPFS